MVTRSDVDWLQSKLADPETITEADIGYALLDQLAFKLCGPGSHTFTVAGIEVMKSISKYTSNSGKSHDYAVTISWTGSDGARRP